MSRKITIRQPISPLLERLIDALFWLRALRSLSFLQPFRLPSFHRPIVRMGFFMVFGARAAEKEQNFLSVGTAHTPSVQRWWIVVKRSTVTPRTIEEFVGKRYG
jgi:hypothetical protein